VVKFFLILIMTADIELKPRTQNVRKTHSVSKLKGLPRMEQPFELVRGGRL
jgi:hypothetical protein